MGKIDAKIIFIVCDVIIAILLVALAIYKFTYSYLGYVRYILCVFYICYALILILADFIEAVKGWFNFLATLYGKGIYIMYAGILCFDVAKRIQGDFFKVNLSFGIIISAYGLFLLIYGCITGH